MFIRHLISLKNFAIQLYADGVLVLVGADSGGENGILLQFCKSLLVIRSLEIKNLKSDSFFCLIR